MWFTVRGKVSGTVILLLDVVPAILCLFWALYVYIYNKNSIYPKLFTYGFLLGCVWEFGFDLMGDEFVSILVPKMLIIPGIRGISHSLWDGMLFSIGVWLCEDILEGPYFVKFSFKEIMIMFIWGNL